MSAQKSHFFREMTFLFAPLAQAACGVRAVWQLFCAKIPRRFMILVIATMVNSVYTGDVLSLAPGG
jgi:putative effector of murein hydrolase LrgA (UPF0299 family)